MTPAKKAATARKTPTTIDEYLAPLPDAFVRKVVQWRHPKASAGTT